MADQSIFDLLQPPSTEGIRGALLGGLQDISNFFAKETPALLRDPTQDIGVGEAAILGAISGLGAPGRRREEARKQAVQSAQAFFPSLSPESQQQVVSAVAPGLELKKPDLTAPQKATLDEAMSIIGDENETPETRQSALEVISTLAPETTDAIQRFAFTETGKPLDEGEQLVFQTNLQRIFTPDSIRKYLTSVPPGKSLRFGDVSLLERLPQKGQARGAGDHSEIRSLCGISSRSNR